MIFSCYGTSKLDPFDLARSAGQHMHEMMHMIADDSRNEGLAPFSQKLKYRHELTQRAIMPGHDEAMLIDRWQAPFETDDLGLGDCEDLAMKWCWNPARLKRPAKFYEPASYQSGTHTVHAVVAAWGRGDLWQGDKRMELYVPSIDRFVAYGNPEGIGLIDPSYMCGMWHPHGHLIPGHASDDPHYFTGASRCTDENDITDRLNVMHLSKRFNDSAGIAIYRGKGY